MDQFRKFFPDHRASEQSPTADCPEGNVSWYDAARYCRRLSEAEGIPESEMVYPPTKGTQTERYYSDERELVLPADWQRRTGYRLPTEDEWEFACRAGTATVRFYGATDDALSKYGWWLGNSDSRCWPVGSLRPNPFGLFDILGNVGEWCAEADELTSADVDPLAILRGQHLAYRGGTYQTLARDLRPHKTNFARPIWGFSYNGFRVVRTVRPGALRSSARSEIRGNLESRCRSGCRSRCRCLDFEVGVFLSTENEHDQP